MEASTTPRTQIHSETLRKFVRRGSRQSISKLLGKIRPEDVAVMLKGLTPDQRLDVYRILAQDYPERAAQVLTDLDAPERTLLIEHLDAGEIATMLSEMAVDDAVFIVESLPSNLQEEVLELVDLQDQLSEVQLQLAYEEDSSGRLMTTEFFSLHQDTTVREAIAAVQENQDVEALFYVYMVDREQRLVGVTSLRILLLSSPDRALREVMKRDILFVRTDTDQEEAAKLATRYDLLAVPVLDHQNRLVGVITYDDIVDVVREEATEDLMKMVGSSEEELIYSDRTFKVAGIRLPWLIFNLVGSTFAGQLLVMFQKSASMALYLVAFVPVVMAMGGNTGTQTATLAVRGLATGRLERHSVGSFLLQQFKTGFLISLALAPIIGLIGGFVEKDWLFGLMLCVSLIVAMTWASIAGALIPLFFDKVGIDPAVAANPLVTTASDISGILIYYGLAALMLGWMG